MISLRLIDLITPVDLDLFSPAALSALAMCKVTLDVLRNAPVSRQRRQASKRAIDRPFKFKKVTACTYRGVAS